MKKLLTISLILLLSMTCLFAKTETVNMFGMKITTSDDGVWPTAEISRIGYGKLPQPRGGSVTDFVMYEVEGGSWGALGYNFSSNVMSATKDYARQVYNNGYCYRSDSGSDGYKKVDMQYLVMEMEGAYLFSAMDSSGKPVVVSTSMEDNDSHTMTIVIGTVLF
jgi:hypothetical protein